jgi:putative membrane protein insertion efficiency factor
MMNFFNTIFRFVLLTLIRFYQRAISPYLPKGCRYSPSCSQYSIDAISKYGAAKGSVMAVKRVCSCHPWGGHGYDPVP